MKYFNIRIVMVMLSLFMVSPTFADILQKIKIGDLYYNLDEDTKEASVTCQDKTVFDPWTPNVYYELTSVTIPENVTYKNKTYKVTAIAEYTFCSRQQAPCRVSKLSPQPFSAASGRSPEQCWAASCSA